MAENDFNYTIVPFKSHGFFWITFKGELDMRRMALAHETFTSHPDYSPEIDELLDFTQTSIKHMTRTEIEVVRDYMLQRPDRHNVKSVMIVNSQVEFGLARMMGLSLDRDVAVDRWVSYSVREALEWLRPEQADELMAEHEKALQSGDLSTSGSL